MLARVKEKLEAIRHGKNRIRWEQRSCPSCGLDERVRHFIKFSICYDRCGRCRTTYVNPVPSAEELKELYDVTGGLVHADERRLELDFLPSRYRREEPLLTSSTGRLLDIGCATGSFLSRAEELGFSEMMGVDVSKPDVEYARSRGYDARCGDFVTLSLEADSFDVVTCWATLEHVPDPFSFCQEAFRVLKPGGLFAVSVPSAGGISFRLLGAKWHMVGVDHLNYFTRKGMHRLLTRAGFEIERVTSRSFNPLAFIRDLKGRHVFGSMTDQELIDETVEIAGLRRNGVVQLAERLVDVGVGKAGIGDLLLAAGRKHAVPGEARIADS